MERGIPCQEAATVVITVVFSGTRTYGYFAYVANAVPIRVNLIGIWNVNAVVEPVRNTIVIDILARRKGRAAQCVYDVVEYSPTGWFARLRIGVVAVHGFAVGGA